MSLISKFIRSNGIFRASDEGAEGYSVVTVDVPNSYTAGDEGKVVQSGALVNQSAITVTQNGTYDTTVNDTVAVNVSGGIEGVYEGTAAPSSNLGSDGDLYIRKVELPNSVKFVDFLRNSGTQWIETGLYGNRDTVVYVEQIWNNTTAVIARNTGTSRTIGVGDQSGGKVSLDFNSTRTAASPTVGDRISCYVGNFFKMLDGVVLDARVTTSAFTTPKTFRLFAVNSSDSYGFHISNGATICRATFRQSGVIVADYLPALDANDVPCMYEAVSGTYVYNSGTGTFAYGNQVTPREAYSVYQKISGAWVIFPSAPAL